MMLNRWTLTAAAVVGLGVLVAILGPLMSESPQHALAASTGTPMEDHGRTGWLPILTSDPHGGNAEFGVGRSGVVFERPEAFQGYTLVASPVSTDVHLMDMQGRVVHSWKTESRALNSCLLKDGHLMRLIENVKEGSAESSPGWIEEYTWDGELVWHYKIPDEKLTPTHDFLKLPNGHVLVIATERKSAAEAFAAGRHPDSVPEGYLLSDCIIEVEPTGMTTGKITWEWHAWDHLVQQLDAGKANYGDVQAHPELINVNYIGGNLALVTAQPDALKRLRSIGYVGGQSKKPVTADWLHGNSIAYNTKLDQLMLGLYEFSEIWIIDHGCTTQEAAEHKGGHYGKGGDLLYRCGNPRTYGAGSFQDQKFFSQHNAHWIPDGLPGAGHLLIFNNGVRRLGGEYSSVDELILPVDGKGQYEQTDDKSFKEATCVWSFAAPGGNEFFDAIMSGAERLPNGDTLVCSGTHGTVLEVTTKGEVVWQYVYSDNVFPRPPARPDDPGMRHFQQRPDFAGFRPGGAAPPGLGVGPPLYRAPRYGSGYPGLRGKALVAGKKVEESDTESVPALP